MNYLTFLTYRIVYLSVELPLLFCIILGSVLHQETLATALVTVLFLQFTLQADKSNWKHFAARESITTDTELTFPVDKETTASIVLRCCSAAVTAGNLVILGISLWNGTGFWYFIFHVVYASILILFMVSAVMILTGYTNDVHFKYDDINAVKTTFNIKDNEI